MFFSIVVMSPVRGRQLPAATGTNGKKRGATEEVVALETAEVWIGAFGRWYAWKWDDQVQDEEEERLARLDRGVVAMEVEERLVDDRGELHRHEMRLFSGTQVPC